MNTKRKIRVALAALASAGLLAGVLSPAQAATRSTVVLHETNTLTGINSSVTGYSLVTNSAVGYLTRSGFNYYDDKKNLNANSVFGSYKVAKSSKTDFRTQWTVNPGRVWSDGTPITGVDLLLSHVLSSNAYSIAAGLGDPKDKVTGAAFKTSGYSSTYDSNIVGDPEISADEMSVTLRFKQKIANWDLYGPGVSPVHALVLMAEGEKELQSASQNLAAKARFLKAFKEKDTKVLKAIADVWSKDYNITNIDSKTNPLLLISNGGYILKSAVDKQSVTLVENPKYNSGPAKVGKIDTIVYKFITDGTAAAQALANGELDVYNGQADADGKAALDKIKGIKVIGGTSSTYEHLDLRLSAFPGQPEYKGIFAASGGQKALDLRRAFLLSIPREEIIEKLIKPLNPNIPVLNTAFSVPGEGIYDSIVRNNGSKYFVGSQAALNKRAASLVKKWYPNAMTNPVKVNLLVPGNNSRRADEYALIKANARKVGFDVVGDVQVSWGGLLSNSKYDASFFGWSAGSVVQVKSPTIFKSTGTQNYNGAQFREVDPIYERLSAPMSQTVAVQNYIKIERYFLESAATLPIFQHPSITAVNPDLKGIKPAPLNPNIVWNYWEWSY
jgi:peptide/nickel transport system substrate-binding protein